LIVILIIAIFLRFDHLKTAPPGLYPDEAIDGNNAVEVAETGHFQPFYIEDNGREGLYVNILAVMFKLWPIYEPWMIRLPAAIAGVLTVLGLYLLVDALAGPALGLLAAFLIATSFWHINFSRIGFRAILAPLLLTWALYLFLKALRAARANIAIIYAALAGIVYGLGFYTYIAYRVTPLLFLLFIPFFRRTPRFWKLTAMFLITTIIVALPIGWYFLKHPADFFGRTSEISVTNTGNPVGLFLENIGITSLMFNFRGDSNWRHNLSGAPELFFPVGIMFLVGFVLSIIALTRRRGQNENETTNGSNRFTLWLMFVWFALAIIPEAASDEGIPHALRAILVIPPVMYFAALGGVKFYNLVKKYWSAHAAETLAIITLVAIGVAAYGKYFLEWAPNPNVAGAFNTDYVAIGREINALPASTPKYVVVEAGGVPIRGLPTPVETTMFITKSFTSADAAAANIHYLLPNETSTIPHGTPTSSVFYIE